MKERQANTDRWQEIRANPLILVLLQYRRIAVILSQLALVASSNYLAFWLRFDGDIHERDLSLWHGLLPTLILIRTITFFPFRLHEGIWRYASLWDLRNIISGVLVSTSVFYFVTHSLLGITSYPRSVFIIDSVLLIILLGGVRMTRRMVREFSRADQEKRVLVFGAGDAGEMIVRDMKNNSFYSYRPVGFVDDDATKIGQRIHGVKVLGTRNDLADIMTSQQPHEVLIAMPAATPVALRAVIKALEPFKVSIKTLPSLRDVLDNRVTVTNIRDLAVEDLLSRAPVGLDTMPIRSLIAGKRVLVTGAGGSIGSELSRQIAALYPSTLILLDRYENGLFSVSNDLREIAAARRVDTVIADITDIKRIDAIFQQFKPEIIFHAAAHKHVPLMELNPAEAVKNNVRGTRIVVEAAVRHGAERFVLISTDKAVNPSSVMGATKRIAEFLTLGMSPKIDTMFSVVRFGNVLGSNGSVVPLFLAQIKAGGPVTLTHPEMRRYFMLIPEAVQLILHAAAHAEKRTIHLLEMGDEIKVLDLARNLIRLSGFIPEHDIPITFVGLRPGEKLSEELFGTDEEAEPSSLQKVLRVRPKSLPNFELLSERIFQLERLAEVNDSEGVIQLMCEIVPTFKPIVDAPQLASKVGSPH